MGSTTPPINGNNIITANDYGIYIYGNNARRPLPVVTGNQIFANDTYNYLRHELTARSGWTLIRLNATGNWWGTTTSDDDRGGHPSTSATATPPTTTPTVNFSGSLDGPGGSPVPGNYLIGHVHAASTTLTAGATYDVPRRARIVQSGKTLTIPANTTLRFHNNAFLVVDGTLPFRARAATR